MQLHLQFGYGMMNHCHALIKDWGGGTVILSPRDLEEQQMLRFSAKIGKTGGAVLFDPQFYLPHADHKRLTAHRYWPAGYDTGSFWSGEELNRMIVELLDVNRTLGSTGFLMPGLHADKVDEDWLDLQRSVREEVERHDTAGLRLIATVALGADAVRNVEQVNDLLEDADEWVVDGVYLVCEHPGGNYLVDDPVWVTNVLDLCAGFRLKGLEVILGYCNHQMLIAACAGANAIASGTYMNVRAFPPDKFVEDYEKEIKQRAIWYYCPQAYSEYKVAYLDIAKQVALLEQMKPHAEFGSTPAEMLFTAPQPSLAGFSEPEAFQHYLRCLYTQASLASKDSFDDTIAHHMGLLDNAEHLLQQLHDKNIRGQQRDFMGAIDANRAALSVLQTNRGPVLRRAWANL